MGKLIDSEFAKELIEDCEKIIKTLKGSQEPERRTLTEQLMIRWSRLFHSKPDVLVAEALASEAKKAVVEEIEKWAPKKHILNFEVCELIKLINAL